MTRGGHRVPVPGPADLRALRRTSPVDGLRRRRLGPVQVLAQSVSATAPAAAMATAPALGTAGGGTPSVLAYVLATAVVLLVASGVRQFARRMVAPGSLYSFTAKGLGPVPALLGGTALAVGYACLVAASLTGVALYAGALLAGAAGAVPGPAATAAAVVVAGAAVAGCAARGVGLSARLVLALEAASIAVVAAVLLVLVLRAGQVGAPGPVAGDLLALGGGDGVLLAVTAFVGFESACSLGTEARRPLLVVPRAVRWTALGAGGLYVAAALAQAVVLSAVPGPGGTPLADVAAARGGPVLAAALEVGVLASFLACAAGSLTALVRLLFSAGREGVLPAALGRAHPRRATPAVAVAAGGGAAVTVPAVLLLAGADAGELLRGLLVAGTCGYATAYVLVCVAAPVFLHRIGELTAWPVVAGGLGAASLVAVLAAVAGWAGGADRAWPAVTAAAVALGGARAWWLVRRRPAVLAAVGLYDETRREDVLGAGTA